MPVCYNILSVLGDHTPLSRTSLLVRPMQRGLLFGEQALRFRRIQGYWFLPSSVELSGPKGYGHHHHWHNQLEKSQAAFRY